MVEHMAVVLVGSLVETLADELVQYLAVHLAELKAEKSDIG